MTNFNSQRIIFFLFAGIFLLSLSSIGCKPFVRDHDQNKAIETALSFSKKAFVERDFVTAFSYVVTNPSNKVDALRIEQVVNEMHPTGKYPVYIKATDYEIVPNSGSIKIYLQGKTGEGEIYYYLVVTLLENNNYKIGEFYKSMENKPYPKNALTKSV